MTGTRRSQYMIVQTPFCCAFLIPWSSREEKSLRHVAMVAKFRDENKPKRHLKSGFAPFQTLSILFNFIQPSDVQGGGVDATPPKIFLSFFQ